MVDENTLVGKVVVQNGEVFIRPATFDNAQNDVTLKLLQQFGVLTKYITPAFGGEISAALAEGFPKDDKDAFVFSFNPLPWVTMQGAHGELDAGKLKESFTALSGKDINMRELITALVAGIKPNVKEVGSRGY